MNQVIGKRKKIQDFKIFIMYIIEAFFDYVNRGTAYDA